MPMWDTAVCAPHWSQWWPFAGERSTQHENDAVKVAQHPFLFYFILFLWLFIAKICKGLFTLQLYPPPQSPSYISARSKEVSQFHVGSELFSLLASQRSLGLGWLRGNLGNPGPPQGAEADISKETHVSQRHGAQLGEKENSQGSQPGITKGKITFPVRLEAADRGRKWASTCWRVKSLPVCHKARWSWGWRMRHEC